jgi:hypothetical protein
MESAMLQLHLLGEEELLVAAAYVVNEQRQWWVHPVNTDRKSHGTFYMFYSLVSQLKLCEDRYRQYLRLSSELNDVTNGDIPTGILARHAVRCG